MIGQLNEMLLGAIAALSIAIGAFFLRFWRQSHDRFFLLFSLSFLLEGVNRVALGLLAKPSEGTPLIYLVRLLSYALILAAIAEKNRR